MVNKVYVNRETALDWTDDVTAGDYTLQLSGVVADDIKYGDRGDLGAAAHADWYEWKGVIGGFETASVVGETVDFYLGFSDGTYADGNLGTTDAAGDENMLPNLLFLGSAIVESTVAASGMTTTGLVQITSRYVTPVVHNNTADELQHADGSHHFYLTPVPSEVQ